MGVYVVDNFLVVLELSIPFPGSVVPEIVPERDEDHVGLEQRILLAPLIKDCGGSGKKKSRTVGKLMG